MISLFVICTISYVLGFCVRPLYTMFSFFLYYLCCTFNSVLNPLQVVFLFFSVLRKMSDWDLLYVLCIFVNIVFVDLKKKYNVTRM